MHIHINALILYFLTFFVTNRTLCDVIEKHGVAEDAALIAGLPRSYIAIIAVVGIVGLAIIVLVTVIVLVIADFVSVIFLVATHVNHDEVFVIYIYFISQQCSTSRNTATANGVGCIMICRCIDLFVC